jgi:hydroxymethylbilane synthase
MRLRLASRKSDLARWQAVQVARALERLPEKPGIEYIFKSSLGDQNLDVPLAAMDAKGVFTEDFYQDLVEGRCDLVVHSWKDLPVEERADTRIAFTLPRADVRDVLLVPERVWREAEVSGKLRVLTSSPRRAYNLAPALPCLLPGDIEIEFVNVRGNVPTRLKKMNEHGAALVLAKAGLDRLLAAESEGFFAGGTASLRALIADCRFQVLPVSLNPPAPAQGALAVETAAGNEIVNELGRRLIDEPTYASVQSERAVLRRYGGGCHQKIGVAVLPRPYGVVRAVRGLTDQGEVLNEWSLENSTPWTRAARAEDVFPRAGRDNAWFERRPLDVALAELASREALFVARAEAWPRGLRQAPGQKVWTAGAKTWEKLARLGVWVNGCQDGLGETEDFALDQLVAEPLNWTKLTHSGAAGVATYELRPAATAPDLRGKTHFFWLSRSSFERAVALFPDQIASGYNACGPGVTYEFLKRQTQLRRPVKVFIGLEQFLKESLP